MTRAQAIDLAVRRVKLPASTLLSYGRRPHALAAIMAEPVRLAFRDICRDYVVTP